jgi:hypothetical protein
MSTKSTSLGMAKTLDLDIDRTEHFATDDFLGRGLHVDRAIRSELAEPVLPGCGQHKVRGAGVHKRVAAQALRGVGDVLDGHGGDNSAHEPSRVAVTELAR